MPPNTFSGPRPSVSALLKPWRCGLFAPVGPLISAKSRSTALNALSSDPDRLQSDGSRPVVITPHPGEMARLTKLSIDHVQAHRLDVAREFAAAHQVYVVLKGYRTLIATPDGKVFIKPLGNPGMATGGTGDVLTGVIGAWLMHVADHQIPPPSLARACHSD